MKRIIVTFLLVAVGVLSLMGQELPDKKKLPYEFTDVKVIPATSVKNQDMSGTCWAFSGISFLESEMMRMGRDSINLSPMWIVRCAYIEKAIKYVRMQGAGPFSEGGATGDVFDAIRKYGVVPNDVYQGLNYGTTTHRHSELHSALRGYIAAIAKNPGKGLSPVWLDGFIGILDVYLGPAPEKFTYNGNEYTPQSFYKSTGLNVDDYVAITSFNHHHFYTSFAIEVSDNWNWGTSYNVPLDEFNEISKQAIDNGYTIYWCADVTESTFASTKGYATQPEMSVVNVDDKDKEKWLTMNPVEQRMFIINNIKPGQEIEITQQVRQTGFDKFATTDDHGMHIIGYGKDQAGTMYYKVKNSWGSGNTYDGYFFASFPYFANKTINFVIHKDILPKEIAKKLGVR